MQAKDLDLRELLDFQPSGGIIQFGGRRALLFDAGALGLLRRELIDTFGMRTARGILTRFGFAHGWRVAESVKNDFPWDSDEEWRKAGGRLHTLQGLVVFEPSERKWEPGKAPFAEAIWRESYEAEQHLVHFGRADEAVCWSLCGFASGYLSYGNGREVFCTEDRCVGKGDAVCSMVGRFKEDLTNECAEALAFFQKTCMDANLSQLAAQVKEAEARLRSRRAALRRTGGDSVELGGVVARSDQMKRVVDLARRVARVDSTVLITGESGVGKERVARLIHQESTRTAGPFIAINCGAVAENLLESELFGHVRGAFTGASQDRVGLFEAASGGTLFLDEIGEVSPAMQVKLLRVLQEHEVRRVGENKNRRVDARVVAATNRDLAAEVRAGRFRQDLFYRLRVIDLEVAPLRDRKDDILPLARTFLVEMVERIKSDVTAFTPRAAQALTRYSWPGNVRELANAIERAVVLSTSTRIDLADLPDEIRGVSRSVSSPRSLDEVERDHILSTLNAAGGNRSRAAAELGIGIATLFRKLKQYGVAPPVA